MIDLGIVSGSVPIRFRSSENHRAYADRFGLHYYLDNEPRDGLQTPHFHKLAAVLAHLDRHEWILWMDDDAYFTDFDFDMRRFVDRANPDTIFVVCKSPIKKAGPWSWTFINSGVFFIRNSAGGRAFLSRACHVPKAEVVSRWNEEKYGNLTPGEQAHLIHVLHVDNLLDKAEIHSHVTFNARPYDWPDGASANLYPVVHFPGEHRPVAIPAFGARFGMQDNLVPVEFARPQPLPRFQPLSE